MQPKPFARYSARSVFRTGSTEPEEYEKDKHNETGGMDMKKRAMAALCAAVLTVGLITGCGSVSAKNEEKAAKETSKEKDSDEKKEAGDKEVVLDTSEPLSGIHHAVIHMEDYGDISLELDADTAPLTVTNFVKLAQDGFYDGLTFHRIMEGFMMQGGDPDGNGTGGAEETIKGEFKANGVENEISHERGVISMARSADFDSASSQFFIMHADNDYLDGQYAAFGHVTEGMDIVDEICTSAEPTDNNGSIPADEQPVMESVEILD